MSFIVAIIGRPNVGKSTFFNRLVGQKSAIVDSQSGVTRDRKYGKVEWQGTFFSVIDTGGYEQEIHKETIENDFFLRDINIQVSLALGEADAILFLLDVVSGILPSDRELWGILRKNNKKVFVVANKVDVSKHMPLIHEMYRLGGVDQIYPISASNGSGMGDLLDDVCAYIPTVEKETEEIDENIPKVTIVGKPNVGKSSFLNILLDKPQQIVNEKAGTTRDTNLALYNKFGKNFYLVDTAGIRKKNKVVEDIEYYSVLRAVKAIEESDICVLMIDAEQGIQSQDMTIFGMIQSNKKGLVILINKWDLIDKNDVRTQDYIRAIKEKIAPFNDVPILMVSALEKTRIYKSLEIVLEVFENSRRRISTSKLNDYFLPIFQNIPPPMYKGKSVKIKYVTQLPTEHPKFVFFANLPQYVKDPYKRFIENKLREKYNYIGVPIDIILRKK